MILCYLQKSLQVCTQFYNCALKNYIELQNGANTLLNLMLELWEDPIKNKYVYVVLYGVIESLNSHHNPWLYHILYSLFPVLVLLNMYKLHKGWDSF